jgi:hypothetical protein
MCKEVDRVVGPNRGTVGEEVKSKIVALKVRLAYFCLGLSASLMNVHWALQSHIPCCSVMQMLWWLVPWLR